MSPFRMKPTEWSSTTDSGVTSTVPMRDEWLEGEYQPPEPHPLMSRKEMAEASALLSSLYELVGEQSDEVMAFLVVLLHRRDGASMSMLRWLRSLDAVVR